MSEVWLISGASRGLGRIILEAARKPATLAADFGAVSPELPPE